MKYIIFSEYSRLSFGAVMIGAFESVINSFAPDKEGYSNSKIFFLFLNESICCGLHQNCLIDESQFMLFFFFIFFKKICGKLSLNYPSYSFLSGALNI